MNEKKPELIIIAGPNGSGKTSVTQKFLHHEWSEGTLYINPDIVANEKYGDWNNQDAIIKAAQYCAELREHCLVKKKSFVFKKCLNCERTEDCHHCGKQDRYCENADRVRDHRHRRASSRTTQRAPAT